MAQEPPMAHGGAAGAGDAEGGVPYNHVFAE
jgi:hypothetical protein